MTYFITNRRVRNVYWPYAKKLLLGWYQWLHTRITERYFIDEVLMSEEQDKFEDDVDIYDGYDPHRLIKVLSQEVAFDVVKRYLVQHEPQKFGTCVTHSIKNILRLAGKRLFNGRLDFSEHDIYIDRKTRRAGLDSGMYSGLAIDRVIDKGVAVAGTIPDALTEEDLKIDRDDYPDGVMAPFRLKLLADRGVINCSYNFDRVWEYLTKTYSEHQVRPFQFSIHGMAGWYRSDVPTATGKNYGGHSVMGLTIPFMYRGKRAFFAFDSAYRRGGTWLIAPGVRIVTEDCWNGLGRSIIPVKFIEPIENSLKWGILSDHKPPVIAKPLVSKAKSGDSDDNVSKIQRELIKQGFDIPAIKTSRDYGNYGPQTACAVLAWQLKHAQELYPNRPGAYENIKHWGGKHFGPRSVKLMNKQREQN